MVKLRIKAKINIKIRAGTMIEALAAMVIIVVCTGMASMIFINVMESQNNRLKLSAVAALEEMAEKSKTEKNFLDDRLEQEYFTIEKKAGKYPGTGNLLILSLKALDKKGKVLAEREELINE